MEKLNSTFTVLFKNLIESEVLKRLSEREIDYKKAIQKEIELRKKVSDLKSKICKIEKQSKKYEEKFRKEIEEETLRSLLGGFKLGDEVWFIKNNYTKEKCKLCIQQGEFIIDLNGEEIKVNCPKCDGLGFISKNIKTIEKGKVKEIKIQTRAEGRQFKAEMYIEPTSYKSSDSIQRSFDRLFKTKEECERQK